MGNVLGHTPRRRALGLAAIIALALGAWSGAGCADDESVCLDLLYDCLDACADAPARVACEAGCDDTYTSCLGGTQVESGEVDSADFADPARRASH